MPKRLKAFNGEGCTKKVRGRRLAKPHPARVMIGGRSIFLGYYSTKLEAKTVVLDYRRNPNASPKKGITVADVFKGWLERTKKEGNKSKSLITNYTSAFRKLGAIQDMLYEDVKAADMQACIDKVGSAIMQNFTKCLLVAMDKHAGALNITTARYSQFLTTKRIPPPEEKIPFTDAEVAAVWAAGTPWADTILIFLYSGWRINELLKITKENVDLKARTMRGGSKTAAGKNRIVPIHSAILPFIKARMAEGGAFLITEDGKQVRGGKYRNKHFKSVMQAIGASHTVHETRHTFITLLQRAGVNQVTIDKLAGQSSGHVGRDVYTHKTIEELRAAVEMLKAPIMDKAEPSGVVIEDPVNIGGIIFPAASLEVDKNRFPAEGVEYTGWPRPY